MQPRSRCGVAGCSRAAAVGWLDAAAEPLWGGCFQPLRWVGGDSLQPGWRVGWALLSRCYGLGWLVAAAVADGCSRCDSWFFAAVAWVWVQLLRGDWM